MRRDTARLPEFIIIGAAKAATTWLAHQLRQHPAIFMPGPEPHYFSSDFERGPDWYRNQFRDAASHEVVGEKSADYFAHPLAPQRIAAVLPRIPLLVQLRNPVERAYSDYCMLFRRGTVGSDPWAYLAGPDSPQPRFLRDGLYGRHLHAYRDHFPTEQIKVVLYEDINTMPSVTIAEVCRHIGVPVHVARTEIGTRKNDSEAPTLPLSMRRMLQPAKALVRPLRRRGWFQWMHARLARPVAYPPLTDDLQRHLRDYYRDDVEQLGRMIGRDLSPWLTLDTAPAKTLASV